MIMSLELSCLVVLVVLFNLFYGLLFYIFGVMSRYGVWIDDIVMLYLVDKLMIWLMFVVIGLILIINLILL